MRRSERSPPDAFDWAVGQHELRKAGFDKIEALETCGGANTTDDAKLVHVKCFDKNILRHKFDDLHLWKTGTSDGGQFDNGYDQGYCHHEANETEFLMPIDPRFTFGDEWSFEGVPAFMPNYTYYPRSPLATRLQASQLPPCTRLRYLRCLR